MQKTISRFWLIIGAVALAVAGLYSLVLVIARTPALAAMPLFQRLFHEALVVHVDLSVLVWFLAMACLLWSRLVAGAPQRFPHLEEAAQLCVAGGMGFIALSPLDPSATALMSNYIPVITSPLFFLGLMLLLCGVLLMLARLFSAPAASPEFNPPMQFALYGAGIITLIAAAAFFWSYQRMPPEIDGERYYEIVFWGGGHILQFTHVQMTMLCWLMLAKALRPEFHVYPKHLMVLFSIGIVSAFAGLAAYPFDDVYGAGHRQFFTNLMILANGIAPTVLALWIMPGLWSLRALRRGPQRALWSALLLSLILFIYGGALGALIHGQNVVIPAHYHGSIVGVTLAFMGLAYHMLPQLGYRDVAAWKLAYWQPIVYGTGQLMHISGLAYSGGYGVLRKTPGEIADISVGVKAALGFMGLGGLIAIIGGLMFVVVLYRAVKK